MSELLLQYWRLLCHYYKLRSNLEAGNIAEQPTKTWDRMANLLRKGYLDASWARYRLSYGKRWLINMSIRSISSSSHDYQRHAIFQSLIHAKHGCHQNNMIHFNQQHQRLFVNRPWSDKDANPADNGKIITVDLMGLTRPIKTAIIFFLLGRVLGDDFSKDSFLMGAKQVSQRNINRCCLKYLLQTGVN